MPLIEPLDIEDALRIDIKSLAIEEGIDLSTCATPVPETLGDSLPLAMMQALGGTRTSLVIDEYDVAVNVWAGSGDDYGTATDAARKAEALVCALKGRIVNGRHWLDSSIITHWYDDPDSKHPTIPRVTFHARLTIKAQ